MQYLGAASGIIDPRSTMRWVGDGQLLTGKLGDNSCLIARAAASIELAARGDGPVFIALDNSARLHLTMLACLYAGRTFCIVSADRSATVLEQLGKDAKLPKPISLVVLEEANGSPNLPTLSAHALSAHDPERALGFAPQPVGADHILYLQCTSGSSGIPKLVPVTVRMFLAQCEGIVDRMGAGRADTMACWAPMSHDMGLMAALLMLHVGGTYAGSSPQEFRKSPLSWLGMITGEAATLTTGPSLSLKLLTRLSRGGNYFDLSRLRYAWVGAEPVYWDVVSAFNTRFASSGLKPSAVRPTYGMAETVVGISFPSPESALHLSVKPTGRGAPILGNGPTLKGIDVAVWDNDDNELPAFQMGRIMVRGNSVAPAYWGRPSDLINGWRDTGDLGFIKDGDIFVVGRSKDIIIRGGVNHPAEELEETVRLALEEDLVRLAAFSVIDHDATREWVHVVIEARRGMEDKREAVSAALIQTHEVAPDFVHFVEKGTIPITSSGKVRRQVLRDMYASCQHEP